MRFDFQNSHVVTLVITYQLGIVGLAVVERHRNGTGILYHVEIGENIPVVSKDKSGPGSGRGGLIAPEIGGDRGGDTYGGIYICGIYLGGGHHFVGVDFGDVQNGILPLSLHHGG